MLYRLQRLYKRDVSEIELEARLCKHAVSRIEARLCKHVVSSEKRGYVNVQGFVHMLHSL